MNKKLLSLLAALLLTFSIESMAGTVSIWYAWTGQEKESMLGLIAKYEQLSGNKVEALMVPFDALQGKFQTMAPQGQGPDIVIGPADWVGPFVVQDLLAPIDSYVSEEDKGEFLDTVIEACYYNKKLYGLPESYKTVAMIYNKDLVPEPPETTDEMIAIGKELTNEDESMYGFVYDKGNYFYHIPWIGGFGGKVLDENNNPTFTSKAQVDAVNFVNSLSKEPNKIMPEEVDYNVMMTLFNDGLAGMIMAGPWVIGDLMEAGVNFGIARLPMVSATGLWPAPTVGPEVVMMGSGSKNKDLAYDLIKFICSADSQVEMAKVGHLPSRTAVYDSRSVKKGKVFEYIEGFRKQAEVGTPMPTAPELNAGVWGNGGTFLSQVFSGEATADEVGKDMQQRAEESIADLRGTK